MGSTTRYRPALSLVSSWIVLAMLGVLAPQVMANTAEAPSRIFGIYLYDGAGNIARSRSIDTSLLGGATPGADATRAKVLSAEPSSIAPVVATEAAGGAGTAIEPYYPANNGFYGTPEATTLEPGATFDRYGTDFGRYASPEGTPLYQRALPPGSEDGVYSVFRVVEPLTVDAGAVAPAFGSFGGGTQYYLPSSINALLKAGVIERVVP